MRIKPIFSVLLIFTIILSFLLGMMVSENMWKCPACIYDSGNIVPLVNENYFNFTLNEIENAKSKIDIVLYEFKFYETENAATMLRDALIKKYKEGVSVRIILDQSEWYGKETELSKSNKQTAKILAESGIDVKMDSLKRTTHNKLLIIDDESVIVGSHNWGSSALTKNNEASVYIKDLKTAEYYRNYFEFLWNNT